MRKGWDDIGVCLHQEIRNGIESFMFPTMTPIQAAAIPKLVNKKDVVAEAITGSGKTLAFLVPILEILKRRESEQKWKKHEIGALVISPTRELALQTKQVLEQLLNFVTGITQLILVGGNSIEDDVRNFRNNGGNVIICTPGRFEDLLIRKTDVNFAISLKSLEILILDEADRLLDYGFKKSIDAILGYLPRQRRTGLFSATQTEQLQDLIRAGLRNPVLVSVTVKTERSTPLKLDNFYIVAKNNNKMAALLSFLKNKQVTKGIVFLPTCACVDYWSSVLEDICDMKHILAIHGKMKNKRNKILDKFRGISEGLLLCTDVMARGIDIPEIDWVLQWDPPANASAFVHRVGRTARQGHEGSSVIFLLENEECYIHFIEKNQRVKLEKLLDTSQDHDASRLMEKLRNLQKSDRNLMEKANRAFVSHVRAYSKLECSLLLPLKELPFDDLASTYGLLRLPKMPELKNYNFNFHPVDLDLNAIPYKDKKREEARLQKLEIYRKTGSWPGKKTKIFKKSTEAWSIAKKKRIDSKHKRLKRKKAKENKKDKGEKRKKSLSQEDLAELAQDIALIKKFKKKKITKEEFDKQFGDF